MNRGAKIIPLHPERKADVFGEVLRDHVADRSRMRGTAIRQRWPWLLAAAGLALTALAFWQAL